MNSSNPIVELWLRPLAIDLVLVPEAGLATIADGNPASGTA